jgi:sialic acid synthase SpsE
MIPVHIGQVPVGDGAPCVLVAEIGTFFNDDIGLAKDYLAGVAAAGVPVFKTEILHDADVCLRDTGLNCRFAHAAGVTFEDYRRLIERKTIPLKKYAELFAMSRELGLPFLASVYDFSGIDFLVAEGGAAIKIARHNIDHFPLIRHAARTGLPLIFDAGVVYVHEIARALHAAQAEGATQLVINHHPGPSPAPPEAHHLRVIETYHRMFDVPVGLSCHYRGDEILFTAIGAGCDLIEKGVVDDPDRNEQEVVSAAALAGLRTLVERVRACSAALGRAQPVVPEPRDLSVRKGLIASRAIAAGERLTADNVAYAWPPLGVPVAAVDEVLDHAAAARALARGEVIRWPDLRFHDAT